jgi:hypothetical protein
MAEQENEPNIVEKIVSFFSGGGGGNTGGQGSAPGNDEANDGDADVGFMNSLMMGLGLRDRTDDYYRATLDTINRNQGAAAAERYRQQIMGQGVLSVPGALSNYDIATMSITGQPPIPAVPQVPVPQAPMTVIPQTMQPPMQQGVGSLMQPPGAIRPLV